MARKELTPAEAFKAVSKAGIKVQSAKPTRTKGEDGKVREGFNTETVALREEHIVSAADYGTHVTVVTNDGRRHEVRANA